MGVTWQTALQVFQSGLAAIAIYFIYELIREYKGFKKEASADLISLRAERRQYEVAVMAASLKLDEMKVKTEGALQTINHEIKVFRESVVLVGKQAERAEAFMRKTYELANILNNKFKEHDRDIKTIKIKIGDMTIYKSGK